MQNNQIDLSGFEHPVIDGWMRDLNTAAYLLVDTPAGEEERLVVMGNDINNGAYQDFAVLPGYTYELKYKLAFGGSGTMNLKVNEGATTIASDSKTTNGSYTLNFTPTASTVRVHYAGNVKFMLNYIQLEYSHTDTIVTVSFPRGGYRYQFNGMEADNEMKGKGNSYTTEFRQYDPRLGRWLSVDPLEEEFPFMSPYVAYNNNPVRYIDPDGKASEDGVKNESADNSASSQPKPMKSINFGLFTLSFRKASYTGKLGLEKRGVQFDWNLTFSREPISPKTRWKTQRFSINNMNIPFFNGTQLTANTQTYPGVAIGNATNIEGATLNNQIANLRNNEYEILSVKLKTKRNDHGGDSFYSFNIGGRNLNHQNNNRRSVLDPSTVTPNSVLTGAMVNQTPHRDGTFDSCDGYKLIVRVQYKSVRTRTRLKIVSRAPDT